MTPLGDDTCSTVVAALEPLETVPEPDAAAEEDRNLDHMKEVHEAGGEELADRRRPTADAGRLGSPAASRATSRASAGAASQEVEHRAALHREGGLGRWVRTNDGVWKGGFSPHPRASRVVRSSRAARTAGGP